MAVRARTLVFGGLVIVFLFLTLSTFAPKKNRETRIVISRVDPTGNYPGADSLPNGNRQSRITINGVIDHGEEQSLAHHSPVELSNDPDDGSSPAPESQHVQLHEDSRGDDQQVEDLDQEAYSGHRSSDVRVPPIAPAHVPGLPQGGHVQGLTLAPSANQRPVREGDFRLLIGVMNPYKSSGRRQIIRSAYSRFSADLPVDIVYISGHTPSWNEDNAYKIRWTHEDAKRWENETFHDLMHLNIQENLEFGKTFEFFKKVGTEYSDKYTHVMKTDDDSFVNLPGIPASMKWLTHSACPGPHESQRRKTLLLGNDMARRLAMAKGNVGIRIHSKHGSSQMDLHL